jgi:hypothetical protein
MRSRSRYPWVVVEGFDLLAAAAKYLGCHISFTDLHGSPSSPPVFSAWACYGPFCIDLMVLPSNVFCRPDGSPLPFIHLLHVPDLRQSTFFAASAFWSCFLHFPTVRDGSAPSLSVSRVG